MAIAGPSYEYLYTDVGTNGRVNDGGVWNKCGFSKALENQELSIPNPRCLPGGVQRIPFVVIGDDAFRARNSYDEALPSAESDNRKKSTDKEEFQKICSAYWQTDGVFIIRSCYLSQQLLEVSF